MLHKYLKLAVVFCLVSHSLMGMDFEADYAYDQSKLIETHFPKLQDDVKQAKKTGVLSAALIKFQKQSNTLVPWLDKPCAESEFRKRYLQSMVRQMGKGAMIVSFGGATFVVFNLGLSYLTQESLASTIATVLKNPISQLAGVSGIMVVATQGVKSLFSSLKPTEFDRRMGKQEKKYLRFKMFFNKSLQKSIEKALKNARSYSKTITRNLEFVENALSLPIMNKKISFSYKKLKQFKNRVLEGYQGGESFCNAIKLLCFDCTQVGDSHQKRLAYFWGPPGTGKTYLAYKIAEFLGIELADVSLANATVEILAGKSSGWNHNGSPGRIVQGLCTPEGITESNENSANMVLFFDEADKVLNHDEGLASFMLKVLDPDKNTFYSPYFDSNIDISNLLIILCGNEPITQKALRNRMKNIEFKGFKPAYRKTAIKDYVMELPSHQKLSNSNFYEANQETINRLVDGETDPGFRVLHQKVRDLYTQKILEKYESEMATSSASSSEPVATSSAPIQNGDSKSTVSPVIKKNQ